MLPRTYPQNHLALEIHTKMGWGQSYPIFIGITGFVYIYKAPKLH